jgi:hypothetical protein
MSHRTFVIDGTAFNVFESQAGAQRFISSQAGDYSALVRRRALLCRRGDTFLTINLRTEHDPKHGAAMEAARTIATEIEKMIAAEKTAA